MTYVATSALWNKFTLLQFQMHPWMQFNVMKTLMTLNQRLSSLKPTSARIKKKIYIYIILNEYSSAVKPLLGIPVQRPDFDMHFDFEGPILHTRVYRMYSSELEELKVHLRDYLESGWNRPSTSEFSSGVIFAIEPGTSKLRMCTDYLSLWNEMKWNISLTKGVC